jgi:spermidine/putrescine transport system substrate-binding protein
MRARTFLISAAALVAVAAAVAGCGSGGSSGGQTAASGSTQPKVVSGPLRLFAYSDGFDKQLIQPFETENPKVQLQTTPFDSVASATAKLRAGYHTDVINTCVEEGAATQVKLGLLQPLDTSRIPGWSHVFPTFKKLPGVIVDGKVYLIPVDSGVTGIMYDSNKITTPPTSWADLFSSAYKDQVSVEDNPEVAIQVGALALGITDPVHLSDDQIEQVKNFLIAHRDNFRTYWNSDADINNLMATGEVTIAEGYPGNVLDMNRNGARNIKFSLAKEGQIVWTCGYGISTSASNVDAAYALLNYYLKPSAQMIEARRWNYIMTNAQTLAAAPAALVKRADLSLPLHFQNIIPASPPPDYDKWIEAWNEVKAAG